MDAPHEMALLRICRESVRLPQADLLIPDIHCAFRFVTLPKQNVRVAWFRVNRPKVVEGAFACILSGWFYGVLLLAIDNHIAETETQFKDRSSKRSAL